MLFHQLQEFVVDIFVADAMRERVDGPRRQQVFGVRQLEDVRDYLKIILVRFVDHDAVQLWGVSFFTVWLRSSTQILTMSTFFRGQLLYGGAGFGFGGQGRMQRASSNPDRGQRWAWPFRVRRFVTAPQREAVFLPALGRLLRLDRCRGFAWRPRHSTRRARQVIDQVFSLEYVSFADGGRS